MSPPHARPGLRIDVRAIGQGARDGKGGRGEIGGVGPVSSDGEGFVWWSKGLLYGTQLTFDLKRHTSRASPDRGMAIHPLSGALYHSQVHLPSELNACDNQIARPGGAVRPLSADLAGANRLPGSGVHGAFGLSPCREAE